LGDECGFFMGCVLIDFLCGFFYGLSFNQGHIYAILGIFYALKKYFFKGYANFQNLTHSL
jgi:hypothetical protein